MAWANQCLVTSKTVFLKMSISLTAVILVSMVTKVAYGVDPSSCHHNIKFMLISACGVTKRDFRILPTYSVMAPDEVELRYCQMVEANMIKGVDTNGIDCRPTELKEDKYYDDSSDLSLFSRMKRNIFGLSKEQYYKKPIEHERRGSFQFIGHLPGALKAKCCSGQALCSVDDFKGFCS